MPDAIAFPLMTTACVSLIVVSIVLFWRGACSLATRRPIVLNAKGPMPFGFRLAIGCVFCGLVCATPGVMGLAAIVSEFGFVALLQGPAAP
jgi:hypothetical protein